MEAVCQATGPALNVSSASTGQLKPLQSAWLECGFGGGLVFHPLSCRPRTSSSKRFDGVKRGSQLWSFDLRCEAAAGVEDSISNKAKADCVRKSIEVAVNGVHCSAIGESVNGEAAKEAHSGVVTYNGVVPQVNDANAVSSSSGVSQNVSANGTTVRRASRNGFPKGNIFNGAPPHIGSANGTIGNGVSFYGVEKGSLNGLSVSNGVHATGSAVSGLSVNGVVNGFPRLAAANGSATLLPELERRVQVPLQVPAAPSENQDNASKTGPESLVSVKTLTPPSARAAIPVLTDLEKHFSRDVADVAGKQASAEAGSGLGIVKFLKGKHILVTGATGFLAKVMVEKILRVQPDVGQLYLLIQPQKNATAEDRLNKNVLGSQLLEVLKSLHGDDYEEFMKKKLTAVSGTISTDGLGIDGDLAGELSKKIDVIVNSAATTTFDERYDVALNINTQGPRRLLDFAKGCPNLQLFLHVSTAFVNGQRQGRTPEKPFRMGDSIAKEMQGDQSIPELNVAAELELSARTLREVEEELVLSSFSNEDQKQIVDKKMMELGMARAQLFGWQDTYVFSKALGEMLLDSQSEGIPVVVLRPSVVESTLAEPFPGWMEGIRMMDPIVLAYGKGQMTGFLADPRGVLDVIPADMVVNALLAAMAKHAQKPGLQVYQVASSVVNPMTFNTLADVALEHFTKDPMLDRAGNPIKVNRMRFVESMHAFSLYMWLKYQLPLQLSKFLPWMKKGKTSEKRNLILQKTLEQFRYLASIYKPYTFYAGRFDVENTESLAKELSAEELKRFGFNVRSIEWADYLYNIHIPGLRRYVLKGRGTKN